MKISEKEYKNGEKEKREEKHTGKERVIKEDKNKRKRMKKREEDERGKNTQGKKR